MTEEHLPETEPMTGLSLLWHDRRKAVEKGGGAQAERGREAISGSERK